MYTDEQYKERCNTQRNRFKECHIDGPWMNEPDKVQWKHEGMDCLIVRNHELFHLCGYVGVKPGHPYFEKDYDDVPLPDGEQPNGGLTYSSHCSGIVCHDSGEKDDVWWLGFDYAHAGDAVPGMFIARATIPALQSMYKHSYARDDEHYHTFEEVKADVERFASFVSTL